MTRYRILPYRQGSASAKALAEALGGKVLKLEGSKFKPKPDDVIINWGHQVDTLPLTYFHDLGWDTYFLNRFIKPASNKLTFFEIMGEAHPDLIPKFWTNKEDIPDACFPIVCRTTLAGHSGAGIVIAEDREHLVDAPLYVQYKKKKDEYRVHVGKLTDGETFHIIAVQRKAKRQGQPVLDWRVRNHSNGFVFIRGGVAPPASVLDSAIASLEATGLDFGAVDVVWNDHEQRAYVLEINTAPGLEGQTIQDYASFFKCL